MNSEDTMDYMNAAVESGGEDTGEEVRFVAIDDEGNKLHCFAIFTFEYDARHYIVYTDGSLSCDGEGTRVFASEYDPEGLIELGDGVSLALPLEPIDDEEVFEIIEGLLEAASEDENPDDYGCIN